MLQTAHFTALSRTTLYCTVLHSTVLYFTAQRCTALHSTALYFLQMYFCSTKLITTDVHCAVVPPEGNQWVSSRRYSLAFLLTDKISVCTALLGHLHSTKVYSQQCTGYRVQLTVIIYPLYWYDILCIAYSGHCTVYIVQRTLYNIQCTMYSVHCIMYSNDAVSSAAAGPHCPGLPTAQFRLLYCTVLYCTVLYCTVLYCTLLYTTVLYCTVLYCTVLYCLDCLLISWFQASSWLSAGF